MHCTRCADTMRRQLAEGFILDMGRVSFVKPHGVVALLLTARRLAALCSRRCLSL